MSRPFTLASWQDDFLETILECLLEDNTPAILPSGASGMGCDFSDVAIIMPHKRPGLYLTQRLQEDKRFAKPLAMPRFYTIGELFAHLRHTIAGTPASEAGKLDTLGLLMDCVRQLPDLHERLASLVPAASPAASGLDIQRFFPWAMRLAALFEQCFSHGKTPENFLYAEGSVTPYAAALLGNLGSLFSLYTSALQDNKWTTPGLTAFTVARHIQNNGTLGFLPAKHLYIAGFFALTDTEDVLFKHLWQEHQARILLHTDVSTSPHWSTQPLSHWLRRWGAKADIRHTKKQTPLFSNIKYTEGFDLHSQLEALEKIVEEKAAATQRPETEADTFAADTAVVLPDTGLLMPALHHLPHTDINISMGYPLSRSSLFTLVKSLFALEEGRRGTECNWRNLVDIIRHPYLKMLSPQTAEGESPAEKENADSDAPLYLRRELHRLEEALRQNKRAHVQPYDLVQSLYTTLPKDDLPPREILLLLDTLFGLLFTRFHGITTPEQMGLALKQLCDFLLAHGKHLWLRFPIDGECLFRLTQVVIPELLRCGPAKETFLPGTLFALVRSMLEAERVPFEARPLVGLQVLGMLETRLLSFRRVIIPECVESSIPGTGSADPLLPESLRPVIGLPTQNQREEVAAYHFFRLLAGATDVHLLWQEGAEGGGLADSKKRKSRFVEELVWKEEKRRGLLLAEIPLGNTHEENKSPLRVLTQMVSPLALQRQPIPVSQTMREMLHCLLRSPVSATMLDAYITCPARFCLDRVLGLKESQEINEEKDPLALGVAMHEALCGFYTPLLNKPLEAGTTFSDAMRQSLAALFVDRPEYHSMRAKLPADIFAMYSKGGQMRLDKFLLNQPETTVLTLESEMEGVFHPSGTPAPLSIPLVGRIDRVDVRDGALWVLDYKTGFLPKYMDTVWENDTLWRSLDAWLPQSPAEARSLEDPLPLLAKTFGSVQLPFYLLLLSQNLPQLAKTTGMPLDLTVSLCNSCWVELAVDGAEHPLFPKEMDADQCREAVATRIPSLFSFIFRHMLLSSAFSPHEGIQCAWCPHAGRCASRA